ncbi:MAG: hypothetical protein ACPGO3_02365 [Magnetospiraceae bacterium]
MTPWQFTAAAVKNLNLSLDDDGKMELARLFRLAMDVSAERAREPETPGEISKADGD